MQLVLNQTPFYGESGGQMGDTGVISTDHAKLTVTDVQKRGEGLFVHSCIVDGRHGHPRRCGSTHRRSRPPLAPARQPFRHPSAA